MLKKNRSRGRENFHTGDAAEFRQNCSSPQEIQYLLILTSFLCMVFFFVFRTQRSKFWWWNHSKRTSDDGDMDQRRSCRKTGEAAGEDKELQKFINGGSGPEKFPNLAQMFLRSMRCSRIKLAQKEIRIKEESSCQREPIQLEVLEGKKFQK